MTTDVAQLQEQHEAVSKRWTEFHKWRGEGYWPDLIRRRAKIELDSDMEPYRGNTSIQSTILEEDRGTHMKILNLNPTKIDCTSLEDTKPAKEDVEDVRIWLASLWNTVNDGGWLDDSWSQGITDYGVHVERILYHEMKEPDEEYYEGKKVVKATDKLKARKEYFHDQTGQCFEVIDIPVGQMCWFPLRNPTLFFQKAEISYIEAKRVKRAEFLGGGSMDLDDLKNIVWVGDAETPAERGGAPLPADQKFTYLVKDAEDPDTKEWKTTEYICVGDDLGTAELVNEVVNPLGGSCFQVTASGDEAPLETDPHLRYRPKLYTEMVLVGQYNSLSTLYAAMARREISDEAFIPIERLTSEAASFLVEHGAYEEGMGAQRRLVFRKPEPGPGGEMPMLPGVSPWPHAVSESLKTLLELTLDQLREVRPNRWMAGNAFEEAKEGTFRANLDQHQAAAAPYGADLKKRDRAKKQILEKCLRAVVYWSKGRDKDTDFEYPAVTTGDEPLLKGSVEPGTVVTINGAKASRKLSITVLTKNETQSEKAINDELAYRDYNAETETWLGLIRRLGFDDPQKHAEELEKDRLRKILQPRNDQTIATLVEQYTSAKTNINIQALVGSPVPQTDQQGKQVPQSAGQQPIMPSPVAFGGGSSPMAGVS